MKIMVFGGSGFIGSHLADELTKRGQDVTIFDSKQSLYIQSNQKMIVGSIIDYELLNKVTKGFDVVYNFAASSDIDSNNPLETLMTNIVGNAFILNACAINKIKRFVFASTIYVHSNQGSFYASSKRACEDIIRDYYNTYNLPYTILRFGSVYGPRANYHNWIYKAIHQALTENKITRNSDGEELREYIYVKDAASLSIDILKQEFENQAVNITGNQQLKIKDLHIMIKEILNKDIKLEYLSTTDWASHYNITPYVFKPQIAKKMISNQYYDMGVGLMECIEEVYKEVNKK